MGSTKEHVSKSKDSADKKGKPFQKDLNKTNFKKRKVTDPEEKKALKKQKTQELKAKKLTNPKNQIVDEAIKIWMLFNPKTTPKEKTHELIDQLLTLVEGKIYDVVFRGNASRVFQTVLKRGTREHREKVFQELKDNTLELAKNNHAYHLLLRLLEHGTPMNRDYIINQFYGHVPGLMKQKYASTVLEYIFTDVGKPNQKRNLVQEFFGPEYKTFKDDTKRSLEDIIKENPDKQHKIIENVKGCVLPILNKPELLNHSIIHLPLRLFFEYSDYASKTDMINHLKEHVVRIVHTKDGSKIGCQCIAYGSPKDRKAILKTLKTYCKKVAMEEYAHLFLLRIFQSVDDTVLINKVILSELKENLLEISLDRYGRLPILYILSPKNKRYFSENTQSLLEPVFATEKDPETNEEKKVSLSKKDDDVRHMELLNSLLPSLQLMVKKAAFRLLTSTYGKDVAFETIFHSVPTEKNPEIKQELYNAILRLINFDNKEGFEEDEQDNVVKEFHALDFLREEPIQEEDIMTHYLAHRTIRRLIEDEEGFAVQVYERIKDKIWEYTEQQFSSWVVFSLLEAPDTKEKVEKVLKKKLKELKALASDEKNKANQALLNALTKNTK